MLCVLEPDVEESWRVSGLTLDHRNNTVIVFWKDPPVLGSKLCENIEIFIKNYKSTNPGLNKFANGPYVNKNPKK